MTAMLALFRRELFSAWVTPLAWLLLFVFLVLQGTSFYMMVDHFSNFTSLTVDQGPLAAYFGSALVVLSLLLICPPLTMRSFAEERRSGTIESLLSAPISPVAIVVAKYLAALCTYAIMWLPTVLYAVILRDTGEVDRGVLLSSYLGVLLIGGSYLAIGLVASSLTQSQLVALLLSTLTLFGLFILGVGERVFDPGPLRDVCAHVSVLSQLDEFSRGVVDLRRIVFDVGLIALSLFLTTRVVDSWRQR